MTIIREPIYRALFDRVSSSPVFQTKSRKLKHWSDVPASARPAIFQAQGSPIALPPKALGLPTVWSLPVKLYIYVSTAEADNPGEVLNPILDELDALFAPHPAKGLQTLGGLVQWARIEGTVETAEGTLGNDEVAIVPINMLTM